MACRFNMFDILYLCWNTEQFFTKTDVETGYYWYIYDFCLLRFYNEDFETTSDISKTKIS